MIYLKNSILQSCHPFFLDSVTLGNTLFVSFFLEALQLLLPTIFLQNGIPNVVLESSPDVLEPQINPALPPPPSSIPSTLAAPSHDRFYFLNSLSLFSKYRHIHVFSQDSCLPPFFCSDLRNPPQPHTAFLVLTR